MKKNISYIALACLYILLNMACQPGASTTNDAIVNSIDSLKPTHEQPVGGEVLIYNSTDAMQNCYMNDQLGGGGSIVVGSKDTFRMRLDEPTYLISSGLHQHFAKVMPGDTVHIYSVGKKPYFKTSRNLPINQCLDDWFKSGDAVRYMFVNPWYKTKMTMAERDKKVTDLYRARMAKLGQYQLNEAEQLEMQQLLTGTLVYDKLFFFTIGSSRSTVQKYYADSIGAFASRLSALSKQQGYFPTQFLHGAEAIMMIFQENKPLDKTITFINIYFSNQVRDVLIAKSLAQAIRDDAKATVDLHKMLGNNTIGSHYKNKLLGIIAERNSAAMDKSTGKAGTTGLMNRLGNTYKLDSLVASRKGRMLYIDCWASWCVPCLAEMKNSQVLQAAYKGRAIDFVYLSLDKDKKAWLTAEKNLKLMNESNSFWVWDHFNSDFAKKQTITSIPRYMLIAADGKPISLDAPYPSDTKLKLLIEKYIR
jgi:thiol-disulfide isomerase/thioredoxin